MGRNLFADHYSFGAIDAQTPLLVYVGGAINESIYDLRRNSRPDGLAQTCLQAMNKESIESLEFLALSPPPNTGHRPMDGSEGFFQLFMFDLLPRLNNPRPTAIGFIGNSYGAHLATYVSMCLAPTKGLATIAGCGMADAIETSSRISLGRIAIKVFSNKDDGTSAEDAKLRTVLRGHGKEFGYAQGKGGHSFADYEANGSVSEAFRFVIKSLK